MEKAPCEQQSAGHGPCARMTRNLELGFGSRKRPRSEVLGLVFLQGSSGRVRSLVGFLRLEAVASVVVVPPRLGPRSPLLSR